MTVAAVSPEVARVLADRGEVVLLDVGPPHAFARGHAAGAISIPYSPRGLGARARVALPPGADVLLIGPDETTAAAAAAQLVEAGFSVRGIVEGGAEAWLAAGLPQAVMKEVAIEDLPRIAEEATVIDVREPIEWTTGHVPGARLIPLGQLRDAAAAIPRDRPVITICEAGVRSLTAASILAAEGITDVAHVPAGSSGYRRAGLPLAFPRDEVLTR